MRVLVLLALAAPALSQTPPPIPVLSGHGIQTGYGDWTIAITDTGDGYRIGYPSLDCSGALLPVEPGDAPLTGLWEERIDQGSGCVARGLIELREIGKGARSYLWRRSEGRAPEACGAVLPGGTPDDWSRQIAGRVCAELMP